MLHIAFFGRKISKVLRTYDTVFENSNTYLVLVFEENSNPLTQDCHAIISLMAKVILNESLIHVRQIIVTS